LQIDPEISSALPNQVKILLEMITVISTATVIFGIFKTKNIRFPKTLKLIGNKSFGIYLIHQLIINTIVTLFFFQGSAWPNILLLFIVVVSISMGMILLLEYKPIAKFSKYIGV
jgi:peptidoglycan/LPS O-acetylase OafA/YrhL